MLYQDDLSRNIAQNQPARLSDLPLSSFPTVVPVIKTKMAELDA
jgi:hypothetical protein